MNDKELTYGDFLQRLDIRDVLLDAGYRQNRRFGLRLPSFVRTDSEGRRIRGDKFIITQQGNRLVNLVCSRLLNLPIEEREKLTVQPKQDIRPFDIADYVLYKFDPQDERTQKKFAPYFENRGIDFCTQQAFYRNFCLAVRRGADDTVHAHLVFPQTLPQNDGIVVGFEVQEHTSIDGNDKEMAEGNNPSKGLWIARPDRTPLAEAKLIYWFENAYNAMAY